jgi:hypothetical protein
VGLAYPTGEGEGRGGGAQRIAVSVPASLCGVWGWTVRVPQIGATHLVLAGGAQAIFAMAYGTQSVPKVDKICGPGNQYVTAAKMLVQVAHAPALVSAHRHSRGPPPPRTHRMTAVPWWASTCRPARPSSWSV